MHKTAMETAKAFFESCANNARNVLEIGSLNINGSMREVAPKDINYLGVDLNEGKGVDKIITDTSELPFRNNEFDLVISSSCLEHDMMFWTTFAEMVRVARQFIYISVPVNGPVHNHPVDCWRFYPDAGLALSNWGRHLGYNIALQESFLLPPPEGEIWCDFVALFSKNGYKGNKLLRSFFPSAIEARMDSVC